LAEKEKKLQFDENVKLRKQTSDFSQKVSNKEIVIRWMAVAIFFILSISLIPWSRINKC